MKIRIFHLWVPAVIMYVLAVTAVFLQEIVIGLALTIGYLSLIICTRWADD